MEGADEVLALRFIHPGLAANGAVDLRNHCGRDLHAGKATIKDGGHKAGEISDHSSSESDHEAAAIVVLFDQ